MIITSLSKKKKYDYYFYKKIWLLLINYDWFIINIIK